MVKAKKITVKKSEAKRDGKFSSKQKKERIKTKAVPAIGSILHLQRTIGNQAVQRLFESGALQAKLKIGRPGEKYEVEADKIADQVMSMPEPKESLVTSHESLDKKEDIQPNLITEQITPLIQRQLEPEEEEEPIQAKLLSAEHPVLQREEEEEESKKPVGVKTEPEEASIGSLLPSGDITMLEAIFELLSELREFSEAPPWERMTKKRKRLWGSKAWRKLKDTTLYRRYKEAEPSLIQDWVWLINVARAEIRSLKADSHVKASYYRRLNSLTPYYTQMANLDILWKQKAGQKGPWSSTCNVTSLAMVLNALGVRTTDFAGDKALLARLGEKFGYKSFADLTEARMPDFLQVVVIYRNFSGTATSPNFDKLAEKARRKSTRRSGLTHLSVMKDVASLFNVVEADKGWISSYRTRKPILEKKIKNKKKLEKKLAYYTTARYKNKVIKKITPWLNAGAQILMHKPGHYVRLEDVNEKGIIIDDPASGGKNRPVSWKRANKIGYFYPYLVLVKK